MTTILPPPDSGLSPLGQSVEATLRRMLNQKAFDALDFPDQMLVIDRALKLEAIKQKALDGQEGEWFHNLEEEAPLHLEEAWRRPEARRPVRCSAALRVEWYSARSAKCPAPD